MEVLDFCGPFEVFSVANRFTDPPAFNVLTVAEKPGPVLTRGGLSVNPHHRLADCPQPDLLLVPGGQGTRKEMHNPVLIDWIRQASSKAELVLSVCTGALLLGEGRAARRPGGDDAPRGHRPAAPDRPEDDDSRRPPFRGQWAGGLLGGDRRRIDMSLHVVGRLLGREVAEKTARQMESPWQPTV